MIFEDNRFIWKDLRGKEKMQYPGRALEARERYKECGKDEKDIYGMRVSISRTY